MKQPVIQATQFADTATHTLETLSDQPSNLMLLVCTFMVAEALTIIDALAIQYRPNLDQIGAGPQNVKSDGRKVGRHDESILATVRYDQWFKLNGPAQVIVH